LGVAQLRLASARAETGRGGLTRVRGAVERTLNQFEAQAIPDDHSVVPQLNSLFGDHTYFLDRNGLNIVEPAELPHPGVQAGRVVNLANWSDPDLTSLVPHEPEPTDAIVELGFKH
jgi:hypothetical protein